MKKSARIIVSVIVIVLLGLSISLNIYLATAAGFIKQQDSLSGSVNDGWNTHQVDIKVSPNDNSPSYREFLYSHNNSDHICDIKLLFEGNIGGTTTFDNMYSAYIIKFNSDFNRFDDLLVEFYLKDSDGNTKKVDTRLFVPGQKRLTFEWNNDNHMAVSIYEIRVRTVD